MWVVGFVLQNIADKHIGFFGQIISGKSTLQLLYFPPNQCGEQRDVIDNDIEIDCLNPFPQFKVPKQIVYIYMQFSAEIELGRSCQ